MMRGIPEDKAIEIGEQIDSCKYLECPVKEWLRDECQELNPWMPPDDDSYIIMRLLTLPVTQVVKGSQVCHIYSKLITSHWQWTPYTDEAWKELNKCSHV